MKKNHMNRQSVFVLGAAFFLTVSFFASSYSLNNPNKHTEEYNFFNTENLEFSYVDHGFGNGDILSLVKESPKSDSLALQEDGYRFSVTNISNTTHRYRIRLVEDIAVIDEDSCSSKLLYPNYIKYQFDSNAPQTLVSIENNGYVLYESEESILPGNSEIHELRIWLDENTPKDLEDHYHGRIVLEEIDNQKYESYSRGQMIVLGEKQKYLVLEDSDSKNAYLKLYPMAPLTYVGLECDEEKCFEASFDSISEVLDNYRVQIQYLLGKDISLNTLRIRLLEQEEYLKYLEMPEFLLQNQNNRFLYDLKDGKLNIYNSFMEKVKNKDSALFQPLVILHKDLLKNEE